MNAKRFRKLSSFFLSSLLLSCGISAFSGPKACAAAFVVGETGDEAFTSTTLNTGLNGFDSLTKAGASTVTVTLSATPFLATNSILVQSGVLKFTNSTPSDSTALDHIFAGTLHINSGAEVFLDAKDCLGFTSFDSSTRIITLEVGGTLRLRDGVNQTMRSVTIDFQGGKITGGELQYRSNVTTLKATSGNSTLESKLTLRSDATAPKITVAANAQLTLSGQIVGEAAATGTRILTLDGAGKTVLKTSTANLSSLRVNQINVQNGTFQVAAGTILRGVPLYEVSNGGTLELLANDALGASGTAVTFNLNGGNLHQATENLTARNLTFNLTGGTLSGGKLLFMSLASNPTTMNILASDAISTISSNISLRDQNDLAGGDHTFNVANGTADVDLLISGTISNYSEKSQNMTFAGDGTVKLTAANTSTGTTTLSGTTLILGRSNALATRTILATSATRDDTTVALGTLNLAGFNQQLSALTGSGTVSNSAAGSGAASTLTIAANSSSSFGGILGAGVNLVKTGSETWTIDGTGVWGTNSVDIQEGTVRVTRSHDSARFMKGQIHVADGATLQLNAIDSLGSASGQSWANAGLDLNVQGTLQLNAAANQTLRFVNLNLFGGTLDVTQGQFMAMYANSAPITTINSRAEFNGVPVTQTSIINGQLAVRDGKVLTLNVENGQADTDLWWTGTFRKGNFQDPADLNAKIIKVGDGTLRLSSKANTTLNYPITADAGRLILDAATISETVTISEGVDFTGVNGSSASKLVLNGNYELNLAELTANANATEQLHLGELTFGTNATASVNTSGNVDWFVLNGISIMDFDSTTARDSAMTELSQLLALNPDSSKFLLNATGNGISLGVNFSAIPEPASWALLLLGLGFGGLRVIRRRSL